MVPLKWFELSKKLQDMLNDLDFLVFVAKIRFYCFFSTNIKVKKLYGRMFTRLGIIDFSTRLKIDPKNLMQ